jgi:hypothetical protein
MSWIIGMWGIMTRVFGGPVSRELAETTSKPKKLTAVRLRENDPTSV